MNIKATYLDLTRISHDCLEVDGIDQRFPQRDVFDARVVEPIDIVPDCPAEELHMQSTDTSAYCK